MESVRKNSGVIIVGLAAAVVAGLVIWKLTSASKDQNN